MADMVDTDRKTDPVTSEKICNAQIKAANFVYSEHGILTFELSLKASDGNYYLFGGYALDQPDKKIGDRIPTKEGFECLTKTMNTVGVSKWNELQDKYVRIKVKDSSKGVLCNISVIGNLIEDRWFDIEDFWRK